MYQLLLILTAIYLSRSETFQNETMDEFFERHEALISKLLSGYRNEIPPVYARARSNPSLGNPMLVGISLTYIKLLAVNEPEQTMSLILEYDLTWNDPRLTWNSSEFHDINGFFVNRDAVWRPDVVPYDMLSISDTRDVDIQHVYVKSNGDMLYYASRVVTVLCPLKIQRFPFDHQVCEVGFSSYTFWIAELRLVSAVKPYINATTAGTGEWTVVEIVTGSPELLVEETSETYGTVYYIIRVKRSSTFYIVMIVLPSFILTFLCVLGLFWTKFDKTDYLEKLALGFAAILAMCTVLEIAEQSVPKTTQLPALSLFIMVNLLLITAAITIVVMGSKSCGFSSATKLAELLKMYMPSKGMWFIGSFRRISLIVFPILTLSNLLVLFLS